MAALLHLRMTDVTAVVLLLAFTSMITLTMVGVGLGLSGVWPPLDVYDCLLLLGGAIFFGLAIYFVTSAFRGGEISVVTPFRYTSLLWAGYRRICRLWRDSGRLVSGRRRVDCCELSLCLTP